MPFVCHDVLSRFEQFKEAHGPTSLVDNGQCVRLVQVWCNAPHTSAWHQGVRVKGASNIAVGTAIATFVNGVYPNNPHGNHAAIYLSHDHEGIWVIDQWVNKPKGVNKRKLRFNHPIQGPSNNGDLFYVIR